MRVELTTPFAAGPPCAGHTAGCGSTPADTRCWENRGMAQPSFVTPAAARQLPSLSHLSSWCATHRGFAQRCGLLRELAVEPIDGDQVSLQHFLLAARNPPTGCERASRERPQPAGRRRRHSGACGRTLMSMSCFLCSALLPSAFISASMVLSLLPISSQSSPMALSCGEGTGVKVSRGAESESTGAS
jgi:hypothetical protein